MGSLTAGVASLEVSAEPKLDWRTDDASGVTEYTVTSQTKRVQSKFQKGPADRITDPDALAKGLTSSKYFKGTGDTNPEAYEQLDNRTQDRPIPQLLS